MPQWIHRVIDAVVARWFLARGANQDPPTTDGASPTTIVVDELHRHDDELPSRR